MYVVDTEMVELWQMDFLQTQLWFIKWPKSRVNSSAMFDYYVTTFGQRACALFVYNTLPDDKILSVLSVENSVSARIN